MKNLKSILLPVLLIVLFACSEDENPKLDVEITGFKDISVNSGEAESIPLNVSFNNDVEGSVSLSVIDAPTGIACSFSKITGSESFETNLDIQVSNDVDAGDYEIKLQGKTSDNGVIDRSFTLTVIKNLSATFSIVSTASWTKDDPEFQFVNDAKVTLYNVDNEELSIYSSDENGDAEIYNLTEGSYYVQIESEGLSFLAEQEEIDGGTYGYLIGGVFESQEEIDNSPQPSANVGDPKYIDLNGDFIINSDDKTNGKWFGIENDESPETITIYLIEKMS